MRLRKLEASLKNILPVISGVNFLFVTNDVIFIDASSRQTFFPDRSMMQHVQLDDVAHYLFHFEGDYEK